MALLAALAVPAHPAGAPSASPVPAHTGIYDPRIDAKVEALLKKMTLDEKVGQLAQFSAGQPTGPGTGRTDISNGQMKCRFCHIDEHEGRHRHPR